MQNPKLAAKLLVMSKADQEMREKAIQDMDLWDESLDKNNTEELKKIISKYGWPTISLVGPEAANAAWLIAQHADHDREFQQQCLELLKALPSNEVLLPNIAYLEDRVRVSLSKPQLYGTQFDRPGKRFGPKSIADKPNLNKRRLAMGLSTFEEYRKLMVEYYGSEGRG